MLGDAKLDEHGNVHSQQDDTAMYLDKDGEDREINVWFLLNTSWSPLQSGREIVTLLRCGIKILSNYLRRSSNIHPYKIVCIPSNSDSSSSTLKF